VGRILVCTSVSKANTTGGTFADTLSANGTDSTTVNYFSNGRAKILDMWGIDSDSVAELEVISTKPESTHDQSHGVRFSIPSLVPGGAASVAGHNLLGGYGSIQVFPSDTLTFTVTSTAADDVLVSYNTLYDDLPGIGSTSTFITPSQAESLRKSTVGIRVSAVASGTPGAYGTARAFNADDDRLHGLTWYAIMGWTVQTQVTTVTLTGPDWGGQRIGGPAGVLTLDNSAWFADQSVKWNMPLIPVFNSSNKTNIFVTVADGEASTSPQIDFLLYELTGSPGVS
jgi:hypothetical protein